MALGLAYGAEGGGALPYIEIVQEATDDITYTTSFATWEWTSVAYDTSSGSLWTYANDVLTIDTAGTYRVEMLAQTFTVDISRALSIVEKDPLGVGSFAFVPGSSNFMHANGSSVTGYNSLTMTLAATDKLRISVRRLSGTAGSKTDGANGPIWRITKLD